MKKKPVLERIGDFMEGKGFYIVLFLCVAAIGISGYYLFSSIGADPGDTAVAAPTQVVVSAKPTTPAVRPTVAPTPEATPKPVIAPTPAPAPEPTPAPTPAASIFTWPVKGDVVGDYSLEVLAYDETMQDWRTHSGMDIAAAIGTQVKAVSAGTVESVEQDLLMGTTVVIAHADGVQSIYCNLAAAPAVEAGDQVSPGTVIGSVGDTAAAESAKAAHLHFEMKKDGASVDPVDYLPPVGP